MNFNSEFFNILVIELFNILVIKLFFSVIESFYS